MAWQDTTLTLLRVYINDLDETAYRFTDERLEQMIVVGMWRVQQDDDTFADFTVDVVNVDVTPDPTATATQDDSFVNLAVANAACLIDRGAVQLAADQALRVKDVGSEVDLREVFKAKQAVVRDGYCAVYQKALRDYKTGNSAGIAGAAIMTPFRAYAGAYRRRFGFGLV